MNIYEKYLNQSPSIFFKWKNEAGWPVVYVTQNIDEILGYKAEDFLNQQLSYDQIIHKEDLPRVIEEVLSGSKSSQENFKHQPYRLVKANGEVIWVSDITRISRDKNGDIDYYYGYISDITELINYEHKLEISFQKLKELSQTSHLTRTKNLSAFNETIKNLNNASIALININRFNNLNNLYGYSIGDKVILKLSEYLNAALKNSSLELFHIHVDEFAVLNTSMEFDTFVKKMYEIQEFINANRIEINTKEMPLNVTVAMSDAPIQDLMTSCSMAMHQAKESRQKFKIYMYDSRTTAQYQSNIEWTMRIQEAIKNNQVIPFYQPIYETKTQKINKYEALIRIKNDKEYTRPCYFLDIAKKSNLYLDLSLSMIQKVFEMIKTSPFTFSINLTYEDIENDNVRRYCLEQLNDPNIAQRVIFEIVESEKLQNMNIANEFIHAAKRFGAKISIDDFGSGYSNFEYLLRLDADFIKIDGSLIKDIDTNIDSEDIVRTIVSFAKKKSIKTVAEFVSSKEIYDKICEIDIDFMQGFYIGKPNNTLDILK